MELDASEQERRQLAYSTQFFDFTPDAFVDGVSGACYEAINEHLDVSIALFSSHLQAMIVVRDSGFDIVVFGFFLQISNFDYVFKHFVFKHKMFEK